MPETTHHEEVQEWGYYALYHILHSAQLAVDNELQESLAVKCNTVLSVKCPIKVYWTLFALSCNPVSHHILVEEAKIAKALDIITHEIFQKSDSRPLVKIVTPLVRYLSNLCSLSSGIQTCLSSSWPCLARTTPTFAKSHSGGSPTSSTVTRCLCKKS